MTMAESQCGPQASVIILREAVIRLASASVNLSRLILFSDYGLEEEERQRLIAIDDKLRDVLDETGKFEDERRDKIVKFPPTHNTGMC